MKLMMLKPHRYCGLYTFDRSYVFHCLSSPPYSVWLRLFPFTAQAECLSSQRSLRSIILRNLHTPVQRTIAAVTISCPLLSCSRRIIIWNRLALSSFDSRTSSRNGSLLAFRLFAGPNFTSDAFHIGALSAVSFPLQQNRKR